VKIVTCANGKLSFKEIKAAQRVLSPPPPEELNIAREMEKWKNGRRKTYQFGWKNAHENFFLWLTAFSAQLFFFCFLVFRFLSG
jgi:hypothetical protein